MSLVVFVLDRAHCALRLEVVERVLPMPAVTRLPGSELPPIVLGCINLHGDPIPVLDARRRFGFPPRNPALSTRLLIATTSRRRLALPVDAVIGVEHVPGDAIASSATLLPGLRPAAGVVALAGGLLFIHDLEAFLSLEEEGQLDAALEPAAAGPRSGA